MRAAEGRSQTTARATSKWWRVSRTALLSTGLTCAALLVPRSGQTQSVPVVPTQWIAKVITESLGRSPTPSEWNWWVSLHSAAGCNAATLRAAGEALFTSDEFSQRGYDNAEKMLALYRGALNRELREADVNAFLPALNAGTLSWSAFVTAIFNAPGFTALVPQICSPTDPAYGFSAAPPGDLKLWSGGGRSRTQKELQDALDTAKQTCAVVTLQPKETIFIGGDQPGTDPDLQMLRIPPCVTLKTSGDPTARHYAKMGRLVPKGGVCGLTTCSHLGLVHVSDGATLRNVWVSGVGADPNSQKLALVEVLSGQSSTRVTDVRISDPKADGTALRLAGYGTSGVACTSRTVSNNLITAYATQHAQSRMGKALWADGIAVFCEQAHVTINELVDVSDRGIVAYGVWNSATHENGSDGRRTQRSTVSGNRILSAGLSAHVALGADAVGECRSGRTNTIVPCIEFSHDRGTRQAERNFAGTRFDDNTFWSGTRTHFDVGLLVGSKTIWGDNGPTARGASFTNNTTGGVATRVNTGIAVSGMYDTVLTGNQATYEVLNTNEAVTEDWCPRGNVLFGYLLASGAPGTTNQPGTISGGLYGCFAHHPPAGGMERIVASGATLRGKDSGDPLVIWGVSQQAFYDTDATDLRYLKQMGANVVRTHLQWKEMMTSCTAPNPTSLNQLRTLLRRVEENGLYMQLVGLSSFDGDLLDPPCYRDATEGERWAAQKTFWRAVAQTVAPSRAIVSLDLINEPVIPSVDTPCWVGPDPNYDPNQPICATNPNAPGCKRAPGCQAGMGGEFFIPNITRTPNLRSATNPTGRTAEFIGRSWILAMKDAIEPVNPDHPLTIGCLGPNCLGLTPRQQAELLDVLGVHIYPQDCTGEPPKPARPEDPVPPDPCGGQRKLEHVGSGGSGDPLTREHQMLADMVVAGRPIVVGEISAYTGGEALVERFIREAAYLGRSNGWIGIYSDDRTMSELRALGTTFLDYWQYAWGRAVQGLSDAIAPCAACQP